MSAAYEKVAIEEFKAAWIAAVRASDVDRLLAMVTDDVVAMHPNSKTTKGKKELGDDFRRFFAKFRMDQTANSEETVVAGEWAFDRARVSTKVTPIAGGEPSQVNSEVIVILRRDDDGFWKRARSIAVIR
jgi:ketosteroid isomerase-like protein